MTLRVCYKGVEYDASQFVDQHPGGREVMQVYLQNGSNITEMFKATHSKEAEKKLVALPVVGKVERTKNEKIYCRIQQRVERLYEYSFIYEFCYVLLLVVTYVVTFFIAHPLIVILLLTCSQIGVAWLSHSELHSIHPRIRLTGSMLGQLLLGLSPFWWHRKHTYHHIFTNNDTMDPDIQHNYRTLYYPFLLLKWRVESIWVALRYCQLKELALLAVHYTVLYRIKSAHVLISLMLASTHVSVVVFGNHQRQKRYRHQNLDNFLEHQMDTTVSYVNSSDIMEIVLGGFQYHTEHHLFPKIPSYRLRDARKIIEEQLNIYHKQIKYQNIF